MNKCLILLLWSRYVIFYWWKTGDKQGLSQQQLTKIIIWKEDKIEKPKNIFLYINIHIEC